ncbi:putative molybdenum carrier protein [Verrucomicrobiota bacterium sgz303538]
MPPAGFKIVSGGQTGVDRGALDAALMLGVPCGGWCPAGRLDEDGIIPERYPVTELEGGGFRERTIKNVQDSDGTLVLYFSEIQGGTGTTVDACVELQKPCKLIDCNETASKSAAASAADFIRQCGIKTLNVAGPRASEQSSAEQFAFEVVRELICLMKSSERI